MVRIEISLLDLESLNANEESKKNEIANLLNELNEQSDEQSYRPPVSFIVIPQNQILIDSRTKKHWS